MKACDVEMGKLRSLKCWEVLPRSFLPQNAPVMKSRWTFIYKTNELGNLKSVSHRSRFVAKGYSQVQGLHYFKSYAPVASFITLRLLFALASIPNLQLLQTMTYLLPSFKTRSTLTIHQFTVNVSKDMKIDANTFIVFIAIYTA